jgi:hypothetical protein
VSLGRWLEADSGWTECGECGIDLKADNLDRHLREVHPDRYPLLLPHRAAEWEQCDVCRAWLPGEPELVEHAAAEHPGDFELLFPDRCLLCALGYVWPEWPPSGSDADQDAADFIWTPDGEDIRWGAATAYLEAETGADLTEDEVRQHTNEHATDLVVEPMGDELARFAVEMGRSSARPTAIEREVYEETEPGEVYTVAELAGLTGRSERGIRERLGDLEGSGILRRTENGRPARFEATGLSGYSERSTDDSDPAETDWEPESFETLYGHQYENGPGPSL